MGKTNNQSQTSRRAPAPCPVGRWTQFAASHLSDVGDVADLDDASLTLPLALSTAANDEPIAGFVFEVDNVLCDGTIWRRWLLHALTQLGLHTHYGPFFRIWDQDFLPDAQRGQQPFAEVFRRFLQSAGLSRGEVDELVSAGMTQQQKLEQDVRPFPCVRSTIEALHQAGFRLAVLSDTTETTEALCQKLARLGLSQWLHEITTSHDLHAVKPDRGCYQASLKSLGLPASQVAFIGSRTHDLAGAADAGMRTIAFNYEVTAKADAFVDRFVDLRQLTADALSTRVAA